MNEKTKKLWKLAAFLAVNFALLIIVSAFSAEGSRLGDSGERIAQIQNELRKRNLCDGEINGVFDFETRRGISEIQSSAGKEKSGEADYETLCALGLGTRCSECFSARTELLARCIQLSGCRTIPEMLEKGSEILAETDGAKTLGKYISENHPDFAGRSTEPSADAYNAAIQLIRAAF